MEIYLLFNRLRDPIHKIVVSLSNNGIIVHWFRGLKINTAISFTLFPRSTRFSLDLVVSAIFILQVEVVSRQSKLPLFNNNY